MSNVILRLSAMQFEDDATLDLIEEGEAGVLDGATALPLIAYEMMLPLVDSSEDDAMPILFSIDRDEAPARLAS